MEVHSGMVRGSDLFKESERRTWIDNPPRRVSTKRCSALLAIREKLVETTVSCHFTPVRMAISKIRGSLGSIAGRIPGFHRHGLGLIPVVGEHPATCVARPK